MAEIEVGYDRRNYVRFEIKDATEEELRLLRLHEHGDYVHEAMNLLTNMEEAGRLTVIAESADGNPAYFDRAVDPNIVDVSEE